MNWFMIFQVISSLKDDIEEAAKDKQITLGEALDIVKHTLDRTGLSDTVIIKPEFIEDVKKKLKL